VCLWPRHYVGNTHSRMVRVPTRTSTKYGSKALLANFVYFENVKGGLWDHIAVCVSPNCLGLWDHIALCVSPNCLGLWDHLALCVSLNCLGLWDHLALCVSPNCLGLWDHIALCVSLNCLGLWGHLAVCVSPNCLGLWDHLAVCVSPNCLGLWDHIAVCVSPNCLGLWDHLAVCVSPNCLGLWDHIALCLCIPLITFVFYEVRVISKENMWLVLPRTSCYFWYKGKRNKSVIASSQPSTASLMKHDRVSRSHYNCFLSINIFIGFQHSFFIVNHNYHYFRAMNFSIFQRVSTIVSLGWTPLYNFSYVSYLPHVYTILYLQCYSCFWS
jgi:hypothetical protein